MEAARFYVEEQVPAGYGDRRRCVIRRAIANLAVKVSTPAIRPAIAGHAAHVV
jgi:hypothetical protein